MMFKRKQLVMLPSNNKATLVFNPSTNKIQHTAPYIDSKHYLEVGFKVFDLYIISDEEIKECDWVTDGEDIKQCSDNYPADLCNDDAGVNKIVSTTDLLLGCSNDFHLPSISHLFAQPSQSFINKYIEEYNKGNIITDVMVEYEEIRNGVASGQDCVLGYICSDTIMKEVLKVNPKHNTITIRRSKDNYNREETIKIAREAFENACKYSSFNEFIEDNL